MVPVTCQRLWRWSSILLGLSVYSAILNLPLVSLFKTDECLCVQGKISGKPLATPTNLSEQSWAKVVKFSGTVISLFSCSQAESLELIPPLPSKLRGMHLLGPWSQLPMVPSSHSNVGFINCLSSCFNTLGIYASIARLLWNVHCSACRKHLSTAQGRHSRIQPIPTCSCDSFARYLPGFLHL